MAAAPLEQRAQATIVIPAAGVSAYLEEAITSAVHDEGVAEVIVVVDANPADAQVARELEARLDKVEVIEHEQRRWVSATRNTGLARVRTPWVLFLDGDDSYYPGAVDALLEVASHDPGPVAFTADFRRVDEAGTPIGPDPILAHRGEHLVMRGLTARPSPMSIESVLTVDRTGHPGNLLYAVEALRQVGGWDPRLHRREFSELLARLLALGPVRETDVMLLAYRQRPGQATKRHVLQVGADLYMRSLAIMRARREDLPMARRAGVGRYAFRARQTWSRGRHPRHLLVGTLWLMATVPMWLLGVLEPLRRRLAGGALAWPPFPDDPQAS